MNTKDHEKIQTLFSQLAQANANKERLQCYETRGTCEQIDKVNSAIEEIKKSLCEVLDMNLKKLEEHIEDFVFASIDW